MNKTEGADNQQQDSTESTSPKQRLQQVGVLLVQTVKDLITDHLPQWAAAISYFCLLSAFPLMLAGVSLAAYFVDPEWAISQVTDVLAQVTPEGDQLVQEIIQGAIESRGAVSLLSIAAWLWTGSRVFGVLTMALNIAYDAEESYSFFKRLLVELLMTISVGVLFILALSSGFLIEMLWNAVQFLPAQRGFAFHALRIALPTLLLFLVFFLVYWLVPRNKRFWKSALIGAAAATGLFLAARPLFQLYIDRFSEFNLIYGSVGLIIMLMVWAWLVALITLFGGELASHVQMMVFEGRSAEEVGHQHKKRSPDKKEPEKKDPDEKEKHADDDQDRVYSAKDSSKS